MRDQDHVIRAGTVIDANCRTMFARLVATPSTSMRCADAAARCGTRVVDGFSESSRRPRADATAAHNDRSAESCRAVANVRQSSTVASRLGRHG